MASYNFNRARQFAKLVFIVFLAAAVPAIYWQRQNIVDWYRLRGYEPPAEVVMLADSTTMTNRARHLFYVNRPSIDPKESFRNNCLGVEQTIVLGCYVSNRGIYLLDVDDPRLRGVKEITAAHEMLHVAYERLSSSERSKIDGYLLKAFASLADERITKTVEQYRSRDPTVVPNELHSILATEVRKLPSELEAYYQQYFSDRQAVVAISEKYESVFTELKDRVSRYDTEIAGLKAQIDANKAELDRLETELRTDRTRLDQMLASGQNESYNAAVPGYNAKVNSYNRLVRQTQSLIAEHNRLVEERNLLAFEEQELVEAIDSRIE